MLVFLVLCLFLLVYLWGDVGCLKMSAATGEILFQTFASAGAKSCFKPCLDSLYIKWVW